MKFSINQKDLSGAISIASKAVSTKTNLEALQGILIEVTNNQVYLKGNDLNIAIEVVIDGIVEEEGKTVVDSKLFGEIIRKLPNETITITKKDNKIEIICGRSNFKLISMSSDDFPEIPEIETNKILFINQNLFKNMIRQTNFAVSTDETRPILTGSLIELSDKKLNMVSIDGYRLALKNAHVDSLIETKSVIPGRTLNEIYKIVSNNIENDIEIKFTDKYVSFELDNIKIISKILEGEFIKYNQIIPNEFTSEVLVNTKKMIDAIDRASLMARESKSSTIKLEFTENNLRITSNSEIGSV